MALSKLRHRLGELLGRGDSAEGPPVPFVVGMNRSGTTLLRMMLDAHPELTIPPETHFVPNVIRAVRGGGGPAEVLEAMTKHREWPDFGFSDDQVLAAIAARGRLTPGSAVRSFYDLYMREQGKPRWGEKTPRYVTKMSLIGRAIPEAHFIHVIRDGRDVALSVLDRTVREGLTAADVARRWKRKIRRAQRTAPKVHRYTEVRYEDLILDTEAELRRICEFIELPWDDAVLDYHERSEQRLEEMARELPASGHQRTLTVEQRMATHAMTTKPPDADRVQRWKRQMAEADRVAFEEVAGELLRELGYETGVRVGA